MQARVLLVDDELAILGTLSAILALNNYQVDTAASAAEAVVRLRTGSYDLVLTDTAGFDVIRAALRAVPRAVLAILTAYPSRCANWREHGAHAIFEKPISPKVLLSELASLLRDKVACHMHRLAREAA
jgi:DNA-binding response OmpR family regulator